MLIQMNKCKRVLELGTFAAYSTMWLARALPEDGYILTIEGRETHAAMGQENIDRAQLKQKVELKCGRAADVLRALPEDTEAFDFIFIDADKQSYPEYLELSLNLSHSGTIIFLDNVIRAGDIINPDNKNQVLKAFVTCLKRWKIIHVFCLVLLYRPSVAKAMMVLHSQLLNKTTRTKSANKVFLINNIILQNVTTELSTIYEDNSGYFNSSCNNLSKIHLCRFCYPLFTLLPIMEL